MNSLFSLQGKTVLLTGAAGFFGQYFSRALLDAGANLILLDHKPDALERLSYDLTCHHCGGDLTRVDWYDIDQYNQKDSEYILNEIYRQRIIDVLVNNAFDFSSRTGFNTREGNLEVATFDQLQSSFESGVYWAIQTTQIIGCSMRDKGKGSIINIGSMYGVVVPPPDLYEGTPVFNPPGYSMAKAGLIQFTRYSASFLSPYVRVNALSPGAIPNRESSATHNAPDDVVLNRLLKKILLQRMGHPRDLVGPLVFLASDASSYMTGHNLIVDGGLTVT